MQLYGECDSTHIINSVGMILQERLIQGTEFVHETLGAYKSLEELWDGEL